jgi:hypothetical protein
LILVSGPRYDGPDDDAGHARRRFRSPSLDRRVRRFAARKSKRTGFGWKRWSSGVVYERWGLFRDHRLVHAVPKRAAAEQNHKPGG